jgi:hypothetical protein
VRFAIGTPVYREFSSYYVNSLVDVIREYPDAEFLSVAFSYIAIARNRIVEQAISLDLDGILWIDADMQFEVRHVTKILEHAERYPGAVIGALYPERNGEKVVGAFLEPQIVMGGTIFRDADYLGGGFRFDPIFLFPPSEYPWFQEAAPNGDDVFFCRRFREGGGIILAALDLDVKHNYEPGPRGLSEMKKRG